MDKQLFINIFCALLTLAVPYKADAQSFKGQLEDYLDHYKRTDAEIARSTLNECTIDDKSKTVSVVISGGFQEQHFTPEVVDSVYRRIRSFLPSSKRDYDLSVTTDGRRIEDLVPNFFRKKNHDTSRLWEQHYTGRQWVTNVSRPYTADEGLEGIHISLWQSHGRYYKEAKNDWTWQRPRLYGTTEDIFSQTFVIPYIIPMLQNAGAVVYTPRERDWQDKEVIVDNDRPTLSGSYIESARKRNAELWHTTDRYGFAKMKDVYLPLDTPFLDGTARWTQAVKEPAKEKYACWIPDIPEDGKYAVYVSYQTYDTSVDDAHYKVYHKGGLTEFVVNQRMGGSTWVYLGTFEFAKGMHDSGMVVLSNRCSSSGIVTADAVRFGGGMGNMARGLSMKGGRLSGMPRWAEGARYSAQWYGIPSSLHTEPFGHNDYSNDISVRSRALNYMSGGSVYNPDTTGKAVPFEVQVAFHTDAGFKRDNGKTGSLAIYKTDSYGGKTAAGLDRYVNRDLASMLLTNLQSDLSGYGWNVRQLWNRDYGEARSPVIPSCILEMLSHQNFEDMKLAYDPKFKFDFCRSVYKTIVKFVATEHQREYVIQPLPVDNFHITLNETKSTAELRWSDVLDDKEPTAKPDAYVVYTRKGHEDFDNGTLVKRNSLTVKLIPDEVYSFKVTAINKGGESFPSETLAAGISSSSKGKILIINAFTRLEGPQTIETDSLKGFDIAADPGVQYGAFAGFCGEQKVFDRSREGDESSAGLGYSGSELEGMVVAGNTFDYAFTHALGILSARNYSSTSASVKSVKDGAVKMEEYKMADVICGTQKEIDPKLSALLSGYQKKGGRTLISGTSLFKGAGQLGETLHCAESGIIRDKSIDTVNGSNMNFTIYRKLNENSYPVPYVSGLSPASDAFTMLVYSDNTPAGVAYDGKTSKSIALGFPLEAVKEPVKRNTLMRIITEFLTK